MRTLCLFIRIHGFWVYLSTGYAGWLAERGWGTGDQCVSVRSGRMSEVGRSGALWSFEDSNLAPLDFFGFSPAVLFPR